MCENKIYIGRECDGTAIEYNFFRINSYTYAEKIRCNRFYDREPGKYYTINLNSLNFILFYFLAYSTFYVYSILYHTNKYIKLIYYLSIV